jgi:5-methyltetrahydrofolate--homocysteine methyltransferase
LSFIDRIREALIQGRDADVRDLTEEARASGTPVRELLQTGLIAAMEVVGERFRTREVFLPEVLLAARAMNAGLDVLKPHLEGEAIPSRGAVVIGTVEGDLHDIGKNLVGIMLRGAGYEVLDLGNNVSAGAFVSAALESKALAVGMSALLTTTMPVMGKIIGTLKEKGLHDVKTIVGGAAVSEEFAREIGADGYGFDAAKAVEIVRGWST